SETRKPTDSARATRGGRATCATATRSAPARSRRSTRSRQMPTREAREPPGSAPGSELVDRRLERVQLFCPCQGPVAVRALGGERQVEPELPVVLVAVERVEECRPRRGGVACRQLRLAERAQRLGRPRLEIRCPPR